MRYMMMIKTNADYEAGRPPNQALMTAMGALTKAGRVSRREDGDWVLHGEPPEKLRHHKLAALTT